MLQVNPDGRELWEGARAEAAPPGSRHFHPCIIVKKIPAHQDSFGEFPHGKEPTFNVKYDDGSSGTNVKQSECRDHDNTAQTQT